MDQQKAPCIDRPVQGYKTRQASYTDCLLSMYAHNCPLPLQARLQAARICPLYNRSSRYSQRLRNS
jgi:hypothetical protein